MFSNLRVHIIQFPSKRWGFVGTLPIILADEVPATEADVMGQRAHWEREEGSRLMTWKFPTFDTADDARNYAAARKVQVQA
jgi:hypothetical protein